MRRLLVQFVLVAYFYFRKGYTSPVPNNSCLEFDEFIPSDSADFSGSPDFTFSIRFTVAQALAVPVHLRYFGVQALREGEGGHPSLKVLKRGTKLE